MLETILLALVIAKIKGYKIKPLFKSWTIYPILVFELMYLFVQGNIFKENYNFIKYANTLETLYLCSYLALIIKYEQYISAIIGSACIFIGTILNKIAISANNGKMPVFPTLSYSTGYAKPDAFMKVDDIHILGSSSTKLKFLTDVIDVGYSILSIGDIFIRLFVFIIIFNTIKHMNKVEYSNI
ncbi:MAG: DUF5317 family protein [Clostridiaceae bacterium]